MFYEMWDIVQKTWSVVKNEIFLHKQASSWFQLTTRPGENLSSIHIIFR
jgi:hypothetical protein